MTISINGMRREVPNGATLEALVELLNLKKKSIAVELNQKVVERSTFKEVSLQPNDTVEIVHFVGGG